MKKRILNLGRVLNRDEQKQINGGIFVEGNGGGCNLIILYADGEPDSVPVDAISGFHACNDFRQLVAPRLVSSCILDCHHI